MSVVEFLRWQESAPICYLLIGNSIWGQCEGRSPIALFDTREQAEQYARKSELPEGESIMVRGRTMYYIHQEGSLLREFNRETWIVEAPIGHDYQRVPVNPTIDDGDRSLIR